MPSMCETQGSILSTTKSTKHDDTGQRIYGMLILDMIFK